jgi:putative tryptophan/tyrosine transport system substrate-binding protein
MTDRRTVLIGLSLTALVAPSMARAQAPARTARVGYISSLQSDAPLPESWRKAFVDRLRELGWIENQNLVIERRYAELRKETARAVIAELIRVPVDVLVVSSTLTALAAKEVTSTVPIVVTVPGDPVATGLVTSLARPGGNVTGLSLISPDLVGKRLELLKEVAPGVACVAVLSYPSFPASFIILREAQAAAPALGLTILPIEVRTPDEFDDQLATMLRLGADALLTPGGPFTSAHLGRILTFAATHRLPTMCGAGELAEAGCPIAYGTSHAALYRRAATYVDKILKGATPADLPVEQPMQFELVINLKAAHALGLTMPPALLLQADTVMR